MLQFCHSEPIILTVYWRIELNFLKSKIACKFLFRKIYVAYHRKCIKKWVTMYKEVGIILIFVCIYIYIYTHLSNLHLVQERIWKQNIRNKQSVYTLRKYDFFSWKQIPFPSVSHNIVDAVFQLQKFPLPPKVSKEKSLIFKDCLLKSNTNEQNIPH